MRSALVESYWIEIHQRPGDSFNVKEASDPLSTVELGAQSPPITGGPANSVAVPPLRLKRRPSGLEQSSGAPGRSASAKVRRRPTGSVLRQRTKSLVTRRGSKAGGGPLAYVARVVITYGKGPSFAAVTESKSNFRNTPSSRRLGRT